jgi:hypothetical protein
MFSFQLVTKAPLPGSACVVDRACKALKLAELRMLVPAAGAEDEASAIFTCGKPGLFGGGGKGLSGGGCGDGSQISNADLRFG